MEQVAHILSVLDNAVSIGLALRFIASKGGGQLGQVSEIFAQPGLAGVPSSIARPAPYAA